jgi:hypothetical protein
MTSLIYKIEKGGGKIFITVKPGDNQYIFLNIFKKDYRVSNAVYLNNYVFKYVNVENEDDFVNYKILNDDNQLKVIEKKEGNITKIECTFNRIDIDKDKANITYFFKVVENSTHIYREEYETIALMVSPYYTVYERNPKDNNGKITLVAKGDLSNWVYLQVIAQIQQDTLLDYVAYKGIKEVRPYYSKEDNNTSNDNQDTVGTAILIIAILLVVLIVGLVIIAFIIQQKNKSLLNQVKHVSFQQNANSINGSSADPNLLLKKD